MSYAKAHSLADLTPQQFKIVARATYGEQPNAVGRATMTRTWFWFLPDHEVRTFMAGVETWWRFHARDEAERAIIVARRRAGLSMYRDQ